MNRLNSRNTRRPIRRSQKGRPQFIEPMESRTLLAGGFHYFASTIVVYVSHVDISNTIQGYLSGTTTLSLASAAADKLGTNVTAGSFQMQNFNGEIRKPGTLVIHGRPPVTVNTRLPDVSERDSGAFPLAPAPVAVAPGTSFAASERPTASVTESVAQSVVSSVQVTTRIASSLLASVTAIGGAVRTSTSGLYAAVSNASTNGPDMNPLVRAGAALQAAAAQPLLNVASTAGQVVESTVAAMGSAAESITSARRVFDIVQLGSPFTLVADSIGAFIEESATIASAEAPILRQPHRAWLVTATVLAADLVLMTWYYQKRRTRYAHAAVRT